MGYLEARFARTSRFRKDCYFGIHKRTELLGPTGGHHSMRHWTTEYGHEQ